MLLEWQLPEYLSNTLELVFCMCVFDVLILCFNFEWVSCPSVRSLYLCAITSSHPCFNFNTMESSLVLPLCVFQSYEYRTENRSAPRGLLFIITDRCLGRGETRSAKLSILIDFFARRKVVLKATDTVLGRVLEERRGALV